MPSHIQGRGGAGVRGIRRGNPPAVVMIVTVAEAEFGAVTVTELGNTVHVLEAGAPEQLSEIGPVKPPWPVIVRL